MKTPINSAAERARAGPKPLEPNRVLETIGRLTNRIEERFPASGLLQVASDLHLVALDSQAVWMRLKRPYWPLRALAFAGLAVIAGISGALVLLILSLKTPGSLDLYVLLQAVESGINDVVLLSVAIYLLLTMEGRYKRRIPLTNLHRLRSMVHIVDMHQLTKDPERVSSTAGATASSPERNLSRFELARYLDYCSELLSLSSKVAALHLQYMNDPIVLDAVNDIETLAASLSSSVWQKIMILDHAHADGPQASM
jgi:hypothetical protein